jgi:hypothetical protein
VDIGPVWGFIRDSVAKTIFDPAAKNAIPK